jgi:soluble lytic murein transglycosylase-like protein
LLFGIAVAHCEPVDALIPYIIKAHDSKVAQKITKIRAAEYANQIVLSATTWGVPLDYAVGFLEWESDGFQNTIDKQGSGSKVLNVRQWCFGLGKLKVSTANDFSRTVLGWSGYISGRDLIYDYRMNIDLSIAYLAWCIDYKRGNLRRGLNAYRAGPTGEKNGNYRIKVKYPWGVSETRDYSDWVMDCVDRWKRWEARNGND